LKNKWLLIQSGAKSGFYNMAADEHLLSYELPVLRIYSFKPSCITLGYFMDGEGSLNYDFIKSEGIDVTRRQTGGKAVLHANELTFSVSAPLRLFGQSVIKGYDKISNALIYALEETGINAYKAGEAADSCGVICFAAKAKYEVLSGGKKICGAAQKKFSDRLLHHASVPLHIDYDLYSNCFFDRKYENSESLKSVMSSLSDEAEKDISYMQFSASLIRGFERAFNADFSNYSFSDEEELFIGKKASFKYAMPCWIKSKTF
jgi:lipoate-protein ligase A